MVLDKYLSQTEFQTYSDFTENYKIHIPENFNFAFDVVDEVALRTPEKTAMVWCDDKGSEAIRRPIFSGRPASAKEIR